MRGAFALEDGIPIRSDMNGFVCNNSIVENDGSNIMYQKLVSLRVVLYNIYIHVILF